MSRPEFIRDKGQGYISYDNMNVSIHLIPYNKNGRIQFMFRNPAIDLQKYEMNLKGSADFSKAFEKLSNNYKEFFKSTLIEVFGKKITESIQLSVNHVLRDQSLQLFLKSPKGKIIDKRVFLNCSLTQNPIIHDNFIALPFNGTFVIENNTAESYQMPTDDSQLMMPIHNNGGRKIQIFINEFLINSGFFSYHKTGAF